MGTYGSLHANGTRLSTFASSGILLRQVANVSTWSTNTMKAYASNAYRYTAFVSDDTIDTHLARTWLCHKLEFQFLELRRCDWQLVTLVPWLDVRPLPQKPREPCNAPHARTASAAIGVYYSSLAAHQN